VKNRKGAAEAKSKVKRQKAKEGGDKPRRMSSSLLPFAFLLLTYFTVARY
jgi:hypothetical protein